MNRKKKNIKTVGYIQKRDPENYDKAPIDDQHIPRKLREMLEMDKEPLNCVKKHKISYKQDWHESSYANKTRSLTQKKKEKRKAYFDKKKMKKTKRRIEEDDGYRKEIFQFGDTVHAPPNLPKF
eukprot:NODE_328_length_10919_cov_0.472828.p7 type:complete len:124 gc:universal NODE_328_length_10919_cov_0.472828:2468-2839(+)